MSDAFTAIAPDALFVVACPVCLGQVAAVGSLCDRDACCPLCASLFRVPQPSRAAAAAPPAPPAPPETPVRPAAAAQPAEAPPAPGVAEDWDGVITQIAPPSRNPEPASPAPPAAADFELPGGGEPAVDASPPPAATSTIDLQATDVLVTEPSGTSALVTEGSATEPALTEVMPAGFAAADFPTTGPGASGALEAAEVVGITEAAPPLRQPPRREGSQQPPAADQLPMPAAAPLDAKASELVFAEPVRTIRSGNTVIEIRRLTPEERRSRRVRRNILMIVIGFSILLMVVILLGVGGRR